jgi:hypothetical protein
VPARLEASHGLFDEKDLIPPVTFGRRSEKFPFMKAWISIYTIVFAAAMVTALADETKTNTQTDATTGTPSTNEVAAPPPMAVPVVTNEVKPPAIVPLMRTSAVPVQSNITVAPQTPTKAIVPLPTTATSAPVPAVTNEMKPPAVEPLEQTSTVPAQPKITVAPQMPTNAAAPPPESSGIGQKGVWAGGVAFLALVGGLAIFMWRRSHATSQGSLITSAMNENQKSHEDKNAHPPPA